MTRVAKFASILNTKTGETIVDFFGPGRDEDLVSNGLRILTHQLMVRDPDQRGGMGFGGRYGYGVDFENDIFEMRYDRQDAECTCGATEPIHSDECKTVTRAWCDARWRFAYPPKTKREYEAEIARFVASGMGPRAAALMACGTDINFALQDQKFEEYEQLHPPPICTCQAASWVSRGDDAHSHDCAVAISERPNFTYKPSGFNVNWYKYIGRDNEMSESLSVKQWFDILQACLDSFGAASLDDAAMAYRAAERQEIEDSKKAMDWFGS